MSLVHNALRESNNLRDRKRVGTNKVTLNA